MSKIWSLFFMIMFLLNLSACAPVTTPVPGATSISPTEHPYILLQQDTALYSGPGNVDFDVIKNLKTNDQVIPLGTYVDFIKVEAKVDRNNVIGFIYKNALEAIPSNVAELDSESVPWKPLFDPSCSLGFYNLTTNEVTFTNQGDGYYDTETRAIKLDSPLRIKVDSLSVKGASFGSIKILGIPETQDLWWKGITRLDIANNHGYYRLGVRDGTSDNYRFSMNIPIQISQPIEIIFEQTEGKSLRVINKDGIEIHFDLTQYLPNGLFPQKNAYFGTSTSPHSSLVLKGFNVEVLSNGKWIDQPEIDVGLVEIAKKQNLTIGTEFSLWNFIDVRYCKTMKKDFNVAVLGDFSWKGTWLGPGKYDFSSLDRAIEYSNQQGWRVRASHLVWGATEASSNAIPDWLRKSKFSRQEYIQILEDHIKTFVNRYKGKVTEWSIANEAVSRSLWQGTDFWMGKIGPEYIEIAFRTAREADPNAVLIFNDFNNESPRDASTRFIINKMYSTVKTLKEKGVPIDVVGMQMHLLLKYSSPISPKKADVIATMKKFGALGVKIYITEFDVDVSKVPGTIEQKYAYQAKLYQDMLQACLESGVCTSFTTWGISDSTSWITCTSTGCVNIPNADPLMFDREFKPKPAYFAVRDVLLNFSTPSKP